MPKPKGGRGKSAPYSTRQVRVPEPIIPQVDRLIEAYQDYLEQSGDANNPPNLLIQKPIDKFSEDKHELVNRFIEDRRNVLLVLKDALKLKANAGGAIKEKIREALEILDRD